MTFKTYWFLPFGLVLFAWGCGCNQAPLGPSSGTSYPTSKTFLYNNNFDTVANVQEWQAQINNGGTGSATLSTTEFYSTPRSLALSFNDGATSTISMSLSYSGQGDLIFDSYQNFSAFSTNAQGEFTFYSNSIRHMTLGVLQTGGAVNLYTYNGNTRVTLASTVNTSSFHHFTSQWHQATDTSDYYLDGLMVAQGFASGPATIATVSIAPYEVTFQIPTSATTQGWTWYVDNFSVGQE